MELSEELLNDIEIYVRDFLKAKSVARMKNDIKKSMIEKGNDEPNVRRFLDWKEMKDKIEEQDILIQTMNELNTCKDVGELVKKLQSRNIWLEHENKSFKNLNIKLTRETKRLRQKNNKDMSDKAVLKRAKEKEEAYQSLNKKYLDLLNYNRELESKVDTLKNRCKKQDAILAPNSETIKETAANNYGISEEQIYGSYYDED
jgi:hypothetical protein